MNNKQVEKIRNTIFGMGIGSIFWATFWAGVVGDVGSFLLGAGILLIAIGVFLHDLRAAAKPTPQPPGAE